MIVWIVEDVPLDAQRAAKAVVTVAKQKLGNSYESQLKLYWNRTIEWGSKPRLDRFDDAGPAVSGKALPDQPQIVILDLFFDSHFFRGEEFLRSLRQWELSQPGGPAWVILWSVRTGLKDVDHFLQEEPQRDRRVASLKTKGDIALIDAVAGCWRSLEEELYP